MLRQVASGIAAQFGTDCEVVVHDLSRNVEHSIVAIENGHVTGRKLGDGASSVVLEQMRTNHSQPKDHLAYLTRTPDGKILKSTTIYVRNNRGKIGAILAINMDISKLLMVEEAIKPLISTGEATTSEPEKIVNVKDLLEDLIEQSVALVGKPVALMTKDDKIRAIQFLSQNGAFLVTKAGDKIAKYFSISKYTLYSYIDNKQEAKSND